MSEDSPIQVWRTEDGVAIVMYGEEETIMLSLDVLTAREMARRIIEKCDQAEASE